MTHAEKGGVLVKEVGMVKEWPPALHWNSRKGDLKAKPCRLKAKLMKRVILKGFLLLRSNYLRKFSTRHWFCRHKKKCKIEGVMDSYSSFRQWVTGLKSPRGGPERPVYEAVNMKPGL